jgi:zinc transport system permease protein
MEIDSFLVRASLAGIGVALVAGPLGCFVVWRRLTYFGATLSHAALLGIAMGFLLDVDLRIGVFAVAVVMSVALIYLQRLVTISSDTLLGLLAHSTLAIGLVVMSFLDTVRIDLMSYLFGDILAVSAKDLLWLAAGVVVVLIVLTLFWRQFMMCTIHEELARVDGIAVERMQLLFLLLLAVVIAVGMQLVGLLLMMSMLIIPAAAARRFSRSPQAMASIAALIGVLAVGVGLWSSLSFDTPAGPSVVVASTIAFFISIAVPGPSA